MEYLIVNQYPAPEMEYEVKRSRWREPILHIETMYESRSADVQFLIHAIGILKVGD